MRTGQDSGLLEIVSLSGISNEWVWASWGIEGNNLSKLLVEKIDGPDRYSSIDAYTINNLAVDANPIIKKAFNDFIESMIKHGIPLNNIVQE